MKPVQPPDVLLQGSAPRDGHRKKQSIQPRIIEAFSNVTACSKDHSWLAIRDGPDLGGKRITLLLAHSTFHHKNIRHSSHELLKQELQVVRTFGEQERKASVFDCCYNIGDDQVRTTVVVNESGVDFLYADAISFRRHRELS